jgi:predicted nucleic acid-binding protein
VSWYSDASYLVSAFGRDSNTPKAKAWLRKCRTFPILVTRLTLLESDAAMRSAVADGRMKPEDLQKALAAIHRAILEGYLERCDAPAHQWYPQAHRITAHATTKCVCKALDVLHVSAAVIVKAKGFLSFDSHQSALARAEGLVVAP